MVWLFLIVLLLLIIFVPAVRAISLGLLALAVIGILLIWGYSSYSKSIARAKIPHSEVIISDMREGNEYSSHKLYGRVTNKSQHYDISNIQLSIVYKDCEIGGDSSKCIVIKEDNPYIFETVPAGQARDFSAYISDPPIAKGYLKREWFIDVVEAN
jgi:hypothetical protein